MEITKNLRILFVRKSFITTLNKASGLSTQNNLPRMHTAVLLESFFLRLKTVTLIKTEVETFAL
jgi:hypothetical protein